MSRRRIDELLLGIEPVDHDFDLVAVRAFLERRPDVLPNPNQADGYDEYLILDDPATVDLRHAQLCADASSVPFCALLRTTPRLIGAFQEYGRGHGPAMVAFLRWLLSRQDCRVYHQGYNQDLTAEVREHGIAAFYDPEDARDDAPWRHHLIGVGFYLEQPEERGVRAHRYLAHAIADAAQEAEAELAAYLRAGVRFRDFPPDEYDPEYDPTAPLRDVLDPRGDATIDAPRALLTDGVYVWGADLAYYVERYHARLPRAFWHHAHDRGWRIPSDLDVARLSLATDGLL